MSALNDPTLTIANTPPGPDVLAVGAWFKNTVCAFIGERAYVSPTVGDLDGVQACLDHESTVRAYLHLFEQAGTRPEAIAHDLHPDFHSSRFAEELAAELHIPAVAVQHHHAHIVSVAAEHQLNAPIIGLALDGVGLGTDGTAWGGELLWVDGHRWERLAGLHTLRLPGADRAAREPWRMAASVLEELGRGAEIAGRWPGQSAAAGLHRMMAGGLRSPRTSSMGRVFDAVAGLLGLSAVMTVEAEAAVAMEQSARRHLDIYGSAEVLPQGWCYDDDGHLDLRPMLATMADTDTDTDVVDRAAARFHATLAAALADWATRAAADRAVDVVAFAGGCFFNTILREQLRTRIQSAGLQVVEPRALLPGDTAVALGQAQIARLTLAGEDPAYLGHRPLTEVS